MIERGGGFVQRVSGHGGGSQNWVTHGDMPSELPYIANQMDQPAAALLQDLKVRGLLDDTQLIWTTEFGRMPFTQGATKGRDHNGGTFAPWFAGAGIKPGGNGVRGGLRRGAAVHGHLGCAGRKVRKPGKKGRVLGLATALGMQREGGCARFELQLRLGSGELDAAARAVHRCVA